MPKQSSTDDADNPNTENFSTAEINKFDALANRWWDPEGDFRPLHDINPMRLEYIHSKCDLTNSNVLDVGCGGGILAESMARTGAQVTAIDLADKALSVARLHALDQQVINLEYIKSSAEDLSRTRGEQYHVVTCLEMLEHVPDFSSVIRACTTLAQPGGELFFSTINRHPKAYLFAVLGAEYVMNLLPKGTHDYQGFIKPSELTAALRTCGLELREIKGMSYNPLSRQTALTDDVLVNYLVHAHKPLVAPTEISTES